MNIRTLTPLAICLSLILSSAAVQARPTFLNTLLTTYPTHATALKKNGCLNCHVSAGNNARNAYGLAIEKAFKASGDDDVSSDTIKAVESQGSPTFITLINADQNPGHPGAATTAAPTTAPEKTAKPAAAEKTTAPAEAKKPSTKSATEPATSAKPKLEETTSTSATSATTEKTAPPTATSATAQPAASVPAATPAPVAATPAPAAAPAPDASASTDTGSSDSGTIKLPPGIPDHAFHPAIVHFPIALFIGGLILDLIGFIRKDKNLLYAGWFNLALAATSALAAIATGLAALIFMGIPLKGLILEHMLLAMLTTVFMWFLFGIRAYKHDNMITPARVLYIIVAFATFCLIGYVGHLGGLYVYGK